MYDNFSSHKGRFNDDSAGESFLDSYTRVIKEQFPWLPRFMSENLLGYIPGLLAAIFLFSMWGAEDSHDDNVRVLEVDSHVLAGFNTIDDARDFLGSDWYWRKDAGNLELLIYKYVARYNDVSDQEYECFIRKHGKRVKIAVYPGKEDIESVTSAFVRAEKSVHLQGNDRHMIRTELQGNIRAFRVREDSRHAWHTDVATMLLKADEIDRFTSEWTLRESMLQDCDSEDD